MPFNISTFKSHINKSGYLLNNKYEFYINPPPVLAGRSVRTPTNESTSTNIVEMIKFRADDMSAPGIALMTADIQRYGIGPTQKYPISAQINEINVSLLCDRMGALWTFWHEWVNIVYEHGGFKGAPGNMPSIPKYTADYKDNYSTTAQILVYDQPGKLVKDISLFEAFPVAIREVPLDWNASELLKIDVTLTYKEFIVL